MILCLDVGNSQIFGGLFNADRLLQFKFRYSTLEGSSSDQLGIFLRAVLRENNVAPELIKQIAICSVVPNLDYSIRSACMKYFNTEPFVLQAGAKTGLKIKYRNPLEVGADRIANSIAAVNLYPRENIIIADFGTATTICVVTDEKEYLGGCIMSGMKLAMGALQANTAKLPAVEIIRPQEVIGRSTRESIQSGLYYGQLGMIREVTKRISETTFKNKPPKLVATGGFSHLFEQENIFCEINADLVLQGLYLAQKMNQVYENSGL